MVLWGRRRSSQSWVKVPASEIRRFRLQTSWQMKDFLSAKGEEKWRRRRSQEGSSKGKYTTLWSGSPAVPWAVPGVDRRGEGKRALPAPPPCVCRRTWT